MSKKEFAFEDKFKESEMIEEAWEDPRDKARRERKKEEEKAASELKTKAESEKKPVKAEVKEKPAKVSSLFGERPKEIKPRVRINTYLEPEVGEYVERMASEYHLSKNEIVNRMLKAAMEIEK